MIPALVALGARETLGNEAVFEIAQSALEDPCDQPSDEKVRAALTALVSVGCSLTEPYDEHARTPFDFAACNGNAPVVRALLALGVKQTAGCLVHADKHPEIMRLLLAAGARPRRVVRLSAGADSISPLMAAVRASSLESVRLLLAAGASVPRRNSRGETALMLALWSEATNTAAVVDVIEELLDAGADVNAHDLAGNTPLHHAAKRRAMPWAAAVARLLPDNGADGRIKNREKHTPAGCVPAGAARDSELYRLLLAAEGGGGVRGRR